MDLKFSSKVCNPDIQSAHCSDRGYLTRLECISAGHSWVDDADNVVVYYEHVSNGQPNSHLSCFLDELGTYAMQRGTCDTRWEITNNGECGDGKGKCGACVGCAG